MAGFPGLAVGVGSGVRNVTFQQTAEVLQRKILIIGTQLAAKSLAEEPVLITSAADAGDKAGFGSMIHRLALKAELGSQGIPTYLLPQDEAGGAAAAVGEIDFTGSAGVLAGTLAIYISGDRIPVAITAAMTVEDIADISVSTVNAVLETPVIATKTAVTFEVVLTAKSASAEGDSIDISIGIQSADTNPTDLGIVAAITAMTGGSGIPTIADAYNALGTGDNANEAGFTDVLHGYGQDSTTLDATEAYVGSGNDFTGLYAKTVARPFRVIQGDVVADSAGLAAQIVISDARLEDRSQGVISVPGSQSDPNEVAAQTVGHMARKNNIAATASYNGITLIGVQPGDTADRWTSDYDDRDIAVRAGISPTKVDAGNVKLQNVVSYYRPASVKVSSNGWREMRNISVTQNILASQKTFFSADEWLDFDIVNDVNKVTNSIAKARAKDRDSVIDAVLVLATSWEAIGWIFSADFVMSRIKKDPTLITIRENSDGFNITVPALYSGMGNILDVTTEFDISFAVLNNGGA